MKGEYSMRKFMEPEMMITEMEISDVITTSGDGYLTPPGGRDEG